MFKILKLFLTFSCFYLGLTVKIQNQTIFHHLYSRTQPISDSILKEISNKVSASTESSKKYVKDLFSKKIETPKVISDNKKLRQKILSERRSNQIINNEDISEEDTKALNQLIDKGL